MNTFIDILLFAQMKSSRKHVPVTYIPILDISYQVFPGQDVCTSKSLQVTQKVSKWSEAEAPSNGFMIINVDTDLCSYLGEKKPTL